MCICKLVLVKYLLNLIKNRRIIKNRQILIKKYENNYRLLQITTIIGNFTSQILIKMKKISLYRLTLLLLALLLSSSFVIAQNKYINLKQYGVEDGLSNSSITAIIQDKNGFIWVGTNNGLNRFDGYQFKAYTHDPLDQSSIGGNYVKCLFIDHNDDLWIGLLDGKVCRFNMDNEKFDTFLCYYPIEVLRGDVSKIDEDKEGFLWISIDRMGLVRLDPTTGHFDRWRSTDKSENHISHDALTNLLKDNEDNLWISTWGGGINYYDKSNNNFSVILDAEEEDDATHCCHFQTLFRDHRNNIWLGSTHKGLYRMNEDGVITRHYEADPYTDGMLVNRTIISLAEDLRGNVWIGTAAGLNIYSYETDKFVLVKPIDTSMDFREISVLYSDHSNGMWIGTLKGLYYFNPKTEQIGIIHDEHELTQGYMMAILKDRRGRIWMRNENNCIRISNNFESKQQVTNLEDFIQGMTVKCFYEDWKGNVWIGYYDDYITCYDPVTDKYEDIVLPKGESRDVLPLRTVNCFLQDTDSTLWIGTELGLTQYNLYTKSFKTMVQSHKLIHPNEKITALCRDSYGWLWAGTNCGGLRCYDSNGNLRSIYTAREGSVGTLRSNDVTCLYEDVEGTLWVGTMEGLCYFNREEELFVTVQRKGVEHDDAIMGICEDNYNRLWISSSIGLLSYNYRQNRFYLYDTDDGIQPGEFNRGIFAKADDGELLFGGINAVNRLYPNSLVNEGVSAKVLIEDFQIFNKPVPIGNGSVLEHSIIKTNSVTLDHTQTTISLQFVVPNSGSPNKIQYAYMLKGLDKNWNYPPKGFRYASYSNLAPGKYTFCVKAWSNRDEENVDITEFDITVTPPFWATIWAKLFYVLFTIALIYALFRYYLNKEKKQSREKLAMLEAQQQHEMDELKLQLFTNVSHEFRTSLTLILSPLEYILGNKRMNQNEQNNLLEIMHRNVKRMTRLVTQILDFRKQEAGQLTIHKTTRDIVPFMNEVFGMFSYVAKQRQISYTFTSNVQECRMDFDNDMIEKVAYNLLSNAIKYTDNGGHIEMSLNVDTRESGEWLVMKVSDDGIGIDPSEKDAVFGLFYQTNDVNRRNVGGSGLGLNMTRELVKMHDGNINVESKPGHGASFIVNLPIVCSNIDEEKVMIEQAKMSDDIMVNPSLMIEDNAGSGSTILLVEDNPDMQLYIKSLLKQSGYRVRVANDGEDGLTKAMELIPDIIVSDVMMPKMDGLEMLKKLKDNSTIGHIPVMMLTAVHDEQAVLKSLQMGVDEYVTKPFSASLLKARIANLLARRGEIQKVETYKERYVSPFVKQMTETIIAHMENPDLNVDQVADLMSMSTSQLTRKTKALLNTTPYRVVIKTRMDEALRMMKETELNVSEIAYKCGYQELANFSRSFSNYWKESPTAVMKRIRG